jgi:hypothetical protein
MRAFYGARGVASLEQVLQQLVNLLERRRAGGYHSELEVRCGGLRVSDGIDFLGLGVIAAVIAVVVYWVVILPAREKKKRERERERMNRTHSGPRQPWDPNLSRGRRDR